MIAKFSGLAVLILALTLGIQAQAQNAAPPQPSPTPNAGPRADQGTWTGEKFERQELREEMEKIRKEHEELEAARDRLIDECVNAKNAQAPDCEQKKQALHEWHDRLHERTVALREKIEAARKEYPEGLQNEGGSRPWPHANPPPPETGTGAAPQAVPPTMLPPASK